MARTLSEDLRLRVISAVEAGLSRRAAAERFGIGIATAIRWVRAFKATGTTRAQPKGGDQRSHRIEAYRDVILDAVAAHVDITLVELADMLRQEHGLRVAPSTVWRFLDRHAMTVKKNRTRRRARQARRVGSAAGLVRRAAGTRSATAGLYR
jgi:transposase